MQKLTVMYLWAAELLLDAEQCCTFLLHYRLTAHASRRGQALGNQGSAPILDTSLVNADDGRAARSQGLKGEPIMGGSTFCSRYVVCYSEK